ncbi:SDR family oxidoreductase [Candidatus Uabimicrobium amorphum]|uniref:Short-chain dehydrogenase n=1 Tax=Uabimicrobium amorphum TaxID=2596890 RepID=A0A5S9F6I3_UABAM|nr:SDR family oxidoreductase [Candidatus Uabimicrobium amorphum]BBM86709.1 short-chain dehydrogenase [Candidatus Uabimicrobium amorphum]
MSYDIKDKVTLVTGANRGIGKAIVESFIAYGVKKVYAAVRKLESANELIEKYGDKVVAVEIDLGKPQTIISAAEQVQDVEVVVNNAGVLALSNPLSENALESLKFEIDINLFGLVRIAQAFAPVLQKNGGGAFVQLNSVVSLKSYPDIATYSASKAASYSITQSLRSALKEQNTAVLSVHPGPIATDMAEDAGISDIAEPVTVVSEGIINSLKSGDFHLFPDTIARDLGEKYQSFAQNAILAEE